MKIGQFGRRCPHSRREQREEDDRSAREPIQRWRTRKGANPRTEEEVNNFVEQSTDSRTNYFELQNVRAGN